MTGRTKATKALPPNNSRKTAVEKWTMKGLFTKTMTCLYVLFPALTLSNTLSVLLKRSYIIHYSNFLINVLETFALTFHVLSFEIIDMYRNK